MGSRLLPFFCYFGGKWRAAPKYPAPKHDTIIEPFAGAAGYSLNHASRRVVLYEVDPTIFGLWDYLIRVSPAEILALPSEVDHVDNVKVPEPARWLIGLWLNKGCSTPKKTPSTWAKSGERPNSHWGDAIKRRIAAQVPRIKHWQVHHTSYETAPNERATWFIDPPYQECGSTYRYRLDDYKSLAAWCQTREGQVMVCEEEGATWMPFQPFATIKATPGSRGKSFSTEVLWRNDQTNAPSLKAHEILGILPPLNKVETKEAIQRVRAYGQREPIETVDGKIVSGWDEYAACVAVKVKPKITKVRRPDCIVEYICRRNVGRHLSTLDRACIAVLASEQYKKLGRERMREAGRIGGKAKGRDEVTRPFGHERWFETAAKMVGTSAGAVKHVAHLRLHTPDVFEAVRTRKLTILREARDLAQALDAPTSRAKVLELVAKNPGVPVGRLVADVMRSERPPVAASKKERGERWAVYEGPLVRESKKIPEGSIDLVHCDIVYGDVAMAEDIAKVAKRVLVEDGLLAMIAGHNVLDVMNAIAKHMTPIAIGAYNMKGNAKRKWTGPIQRVDALPVLIFGKAKVRQIAHVAFISETKEDDWHGWQKNVAATLDLIASMTPAGSRVLDPCCGSGTTGVAALQHGCEFIGIDIDPDAVNTSRVRLADEERNLRGGSPASVASLKAGVVKAGGNGTKVERRATA